MTSFEIWTISTTPLDVIVTAPQLLLQRMDKYLKRLSIPWRGQQRVKRAMDRHRRRRGSE